MTKLQIFKALLLSLFLSFPVIAENRLPDIGTAGVTALSVEQEIRYGEAYMKMIRGSLPMVDDPVLSEYISELGHKLVSQADYVKTPFNFFLIQDNEINAAAFLGGNVKVHTGLFIYATTESELASVLAHEITHITQRHLARSMEEQAKASSLTIAGVIGAVILSFANPLAGIAALQGSLAANMQSAINYTRSNEYEADRIGMDILYRSGFDPSAMGSFFGKLANKYRYASSLPEMLQTHPLPDTRVTEARSRASFYPHKYYAPSLNFGLAQARIIVRYAGNSPQAALSLFDQQLKARSYQLEEAAIYGKALALLELNKAQEAKTLLEPLAKQNPDNLFFIDTLTDIDLALKQPKQAIERLDHYRKTYINNPVIIINLAHLYITENRFDEAANLLDLFVRQHPDYLLAWSMLKDAWFKGGHQWQAEIATAEIYALKAQYPQAIDELNKALEQIEQKLPRARVEARLNQLETEKQQFDALLH